MSHKYCCGDFPLALADGTDAELYGSAIGADDVGRWNLTSELPPIKFCPWCGVELRAPPADWQAFPSKLTVTLNAKRAAP